MYSGDSAGIRLWKGTLSWASTLLARDALNATYLQVEYTRR